MIVNSQACWRTILKHCVIHYRNLTLILASTLVVMSSSLAQEGQKNLLTQDAYIPDISTFMKIGGNSPLAQTWDGGTVFFTSSMSGSRQVYRITEEGWPYQLSLFDDGIDFFTLSWGGDMAIVGASVGGSEQSQLFLMDTQTGRVRQLTDFEGARFGSIKWAKDDRSFFYRSNAQNKKDFFVYRMSVSSGKVEKIFGDAENYGGWNEIANISQDGARLIIVRWNSNMDSDMFLVDIASGDVTQLNHDNKEVTYDYPTLMPDNKTIWLVCNDNEDGIPRLAMMTVGSPDIEFAQDGWLDQKWVVQNLIISRDYKYMLAQTNEDGFARINIRETESRLPLPTPPLDGMLTGSSFAIDGSCLLGFSGPTRAPDVWRWHPKTEGLTQLTFANYAGIDREIFVKPKIITFKSFDGLEIPAFLYLPTSYTGTPVPFVIHAHGGPESQFRPGFIRNIQYLILNGYGVLAVNPRGSSGYGRDYMNLDNVQNRKNSLKDYRAAVDWLIDKRFTKKGRIGIRGASYGGYVVLGMITEYPDLFSAAVDMVGIANFQSFLENTKPYRRHLREAEYGSLNNPEFLASISPIHKADLIRTPLLVIHGENDPRVPVGEARQIIAAVNKSGGIVDSLIFPDEGHGTSKRVNIIAKYRRQIQFFDTYLKE